MTKRLRNGLILLLLLISVYASGQDKTFTKSSVKLGFGLGISDGENTTGSGFVVIIGYQREIWKDRLRLNPNLNIGFYNTRLYTDVGDQYFNSICLETNLFFDLIKIKAFSFMLGVGALVNNSRGLYGSGGFTNDPYYHNSEFFSKFYYGGFAGGGFRINPANKRLAINILPYNFHFGTDNFLEVNGRLELDFKF